MDSHRPPSGARFAEGVGPSGPTKKHSRAARSPALIFSRQVLPSQRDKESANYWEQVQVDALPIHDRPLQIAGPAHALAIEPATSDGFAAAALRWAICLGGRTFRSDKKNTRAQRVPLR